MSAHLSEPGRKILPGWAGVVLIASAVWLGAALVRGITFALTHAAYGP